jgi:shikimate dehydrogenase
VYVAHDVAPPRLEHAVRGALALGYRGLSVTIPHKVAVVPWLDEVDATARGIGCVNTIICEQGRLLGRNSDGRGALNALCAAGADPAGRHVTILGSGGAARAVAITLAVEAPPARMTLLGVERPELERLTADTQALSQSAVEGHMLDDARLEVSLAEADLLLHCTPIGMHPHEEATLVPREHLDPRLTVFDAVYNPRRTRLLRDAEHAGCRIVEGMEMFLGQAAVQFELWTGQPAPLDVMRRVLEAAL